MEWAIKHWKGIKETYMQKKEEIQVNSGKIGQYMWGFEWEWLWKTHMLIT